MAMVSWMRTAFSLVPRNVLILSVCFTQQGLQKPVNQAIVVPHGLVLSVSGPPAAALGHVMLPSSL